MAERAAHLVDHVFPEVTVRQWVLSLPHADVTIIIERTHVQAFIRTSEDQFAETARVSSLNQF